MFPWYHDLGRLLYAFSTSFLIIAKIVQGKHFHCNFFFFLLRPERVGARNLCGSYPSDRQSLSKVDLE